MKTTEQLKSALIPTLMALSVLLTITDSANYIEPQPDPLKQILSPGGTGYLQVEPADATCGTAGAAETICYWVSLHNHSKVLLLAKTDYSYCEENLLSTEDSNSVRCVDNHYWRHFVTCN